MDLPHGKRAIGTKWVYRNKKYERGIVIKNKTRIEAIRLFLAYASYKDFMVYQMDVKSAFLYGKIKEEVYVYQPSGFEDPDFHDKVYKIEKDLYGLHQAPRAWYETLSTYLLDNGFQRGQIDKTLFIKRVKDANADFAENMLIPLKPKPSSDMPNFIIYTPKKTHKHRKDKSKVTEIPQSSEPTNLDADEAVHEQGNSVVNCSGGSPVNTPGSDEERIELKELMDMCTKQSDRVHDLENVKDAQALEIKKVEEKS
ncbi:putative ribonuclease H-like domain-containing protein [Tanacetum coccineum]|uniref:Ribonuclease H-like domain-containing protein n=1 Tax=Tanacetum coccineum TaxID=301880 RepID=A0ABQ5CI06_9ASTR